jgi:hypothetical protein
MFGAQHQLDGGFGQCKAIQALAHQLEQRVGIALHMQQADTQHAGRNGFGSAPLVREMQLEGLYPGILREQK